MKKVSSLKKKLVAFGLAVCTVVTSMGVNECAAMNNDEQQESWSIGDITKGTFESVAIAGFLYCAYKLGAISLLFKILALDGKLWLKIPALIGTGFTIAKATEFIKKVEALPGKAKKELEKKAKAVTETVDNVTYIPRKVITAGAKSAVVGAKCAVPVIKYAGKAAFLGVKGLYNLIDWLMTD